MLRVKTPFIWTDEAEQDFLAIKSCLASRHILRPPNYEKDWIIAIDASDVAIGASLMQYYDGIDHPVSYYTQKLNSQQQNIPRLRKSVLLSNRLSKLSEFIC